ncbi:hypothetical protein [Pseudonocardia lacus]|uniref:hypothetical protein n=1 Tax=Pseudonocardia lacus TaxID=2835865 RepID=UPI001BDBD982|nr:hypothetical protein [Pseudonocardia lacus]
MGVLGEMFPGPKIRDEASEDGDGEQPWRLGPIDLDSNTVVLHRDDTTPSVGVPVGSAVPADNSGDDSDDDSDDNSDDVERGRAQRG